MSQELTLIQRTQQIIVEPVSATISVVNAGPQGPEGIKGDPGPAAGGGPLVVLMARKTDNQTGISATTDVAGLSVSFQLYTGHRYEVEGYLGNVQQLGAVGNITCSIWDAVPQQRAAALEQSVAVNQSVTLRPYLVFDATSTGPQTFKLRLATSAGTVNITCTTAQVGLLVVRDTGPAPS